MIPSLLLAFILCTARAVTANTTLQTEGVLDEHGTFLQHIFDKYGDNGIINFEGFEHLMANLGLGGLKFDDRHNESLHRTIDGRFVEVHDVLSLHKHNHTRTKRGITEPPRLSMEQRCLSPGEILRLYGLPSNHGVAISPGNFLEICPAIVYQLDRKTCNGLLNSDEIEEMNPLGWIYALVSVSLMGICGLLGFLVVPVMKKALFHRVLCLLTALASGTLAGDALLHLLPHAIMGSSHDEVILKSTCAFLALLFFFLVEAVLHNRVSHKKGEEGEELKSPTDGRGYTAVPPEEGKSSHKKNVTSVAWMVITGDGLHNFTDGLAIGAAFRKDAVTGFATALAVFCHELPHELGDFAILLQNGMSVKEAIIWNLMSTSLSIVGVVIGCMIGNLGDVYTYVYAITAGSFLYIALATLVPEMHKQSKEQHSICNSFLQILGFFMGGSIMFLIAAYEETLHNMFSKSNP